MVDRELWAELDLIDARFWVRLEERFGRCPVCRRPATSVSLVVPITWGVCDPCETRWPLGDVLQFHRELFEAELADVSADERVEIEENAMGEVMRGLAECFQAPNAPKGVTVGRQSPEQPESFGVDFRIFQGPRDRRILPNSSPRDRIRLTDLVLHDLREHPLTRRNIRTGELILQGHGAWDRLRACVIDDQTGCTVERFLCEYHADSGGLTELDALLELLLSVKDRRTVLERELSSLDKIGQAFAASNVVSSWAAGK